MITLYQPCIYYDDGINIAWEPPCELYGDEFFETYVDCVDWLLDNGYFLEDCVILPYDFTEYELEGIIIL